MKKKGMLLIVLILVLLLSACQQSAAVVGESAETEVEEVNNDPILEVINGENSLTFSMADIKNLSVSESYGGTKSSTGRITLPDVYKGVKILDLLNEIGGFDETMAVQVEAKDGYYITFSYDQIMNGDFITYDPGTGDENEYDGKLDVIVAYEQDGEAIDPEGDGPLRLMIIGDNKPVTDGHWAVKWVSKITVKPLVNDWVLHLEGVLTEEMDRVTFETGAAPDCHETIWTDEDGNEWLGIPLYYLVGRVDDDVKHEDGAYDDDLAKNNGYTVEVIAADGYSIEMDAFRVMRNDGIIVAHLLNGDVLEKEDFPLKLVGDDVAGSESISQITSIVLHYAE